MQLPAPQNPNTWPNQAQQTLGFLGIHCTGRLCKITFLIRATRSAHGMPIMISLHKVATQEINTFVRAKTVCHFRPHTILNIHYNDVIMALSRLESPASPLFTQPFIRAQIKENFKAPHHWPLCGEFTGDWWIPRTNCQLRGKWFHLMTSSCNHSTRDVLPGNTGKIYWYET